MCNLGAKVRISERKTKGKRKFFFNFPSGSTLGACPKGTKFNKKLRGEA